MSESGSSASRPRGLQFTRAQARNLLFALLVLGTGILTWLKTLMSQREPAPPARPEMTVSEDVFAPYRALRTPPIVPMDATKQPEIKRVPEPAPKKDEKIYEIELE